MLITSWKAKPKPDVGREQMEMPVDEERGGGKARRAKTYLREETPGEPDDEGKDACQRVGGGEKKRHTSWTSGRKWSV